MADLSGTLNPTLQSAQNANLGQEQYAQGQANTYQQQVNPDIAQTNSAYGNLQNYQQQLNLPQNQLQNIYGQNLGNYNQMYGVNPTEIQNAQQALGQTQAMMAALPQAIQQAGNGRMVTGAQEALRMNQAQGSAQQALQDQLNPLNNLLAYAQLAQTGANQQTGFAGQSQQMQLGALQNIYQDALQKQSQAQAQVQYFQTLQQQGYNVTANLENAQGQLNQAIATVEAAQIAAAPAMGQLKLAQQEQAAAQQKAVYQAQGVQPGLKPGQAPLPTVYPTQPSIGQSILMALNPYKPHAPGIELF
jgi:hypothetical protein